MMEEGKVGGQRMAAGPQLSAKGMQFLPPEWERSGERGKKLVAMCVFGAV